MPFQYYLSMCGISARPHKAGFTCFAGQPFVAEMEIGLKYVIINMVQFYFIGRQLIMSKYVLKKQTILNEGLL